MKMNSLYVCVSDMKRAIKFYEELFDTKCEAISEVRSVFNLDGFKYYLFNYAKDHENIIWGDNCVPSIEVSNIYLALHKVKSLGCNIVYQMRQIEGRNVFEFTDSEGNEIEMYSLK